MSNNQIRWKGGVLMFWRYIDFAFSWVYTIIFVLFACAWAVSGFQINGAFEAMIVFYLIGYFASELYEARYGGKNRK